MVVDTLYQLSFCVNIFSERSSKAGLSPPILLAEQEEERWVMELIREAQAEQAKNPMTPEELAQELKELARDVSEQAKERGITYKDVNRIIDESRKRWRTS